MRCEVVAIGTELLLGQIVDTNSSWLGEQLALAGIDSHFQTKVGDNLERIVGALRLALDRSDAVICCGGLGPTQDDITREAIAAAMGVELERDPTVIARIRAMFDARGRVMSENNARQADKPIGSAFITNLKGTAPGLRCEIGSKVVYAVPGVPYEMKEMALADIIPDLRRRSGQTATIMSRTLRTWGIAESTLAESVGHRLEALDAHDAPAVTIAFLASGIEGIKVRVTAKAPTAAEATALLDTEEAALRSILGELVFGLDDETMEHAVGGLIAATGRTLAVAEGVSGGLALARLTTASGGAGWLRGGVVAHAADGLGLAPGASLVSADAAKTMASAVAARFGADIGLAITGFAGGAQREDAVEAGTVFFGIALDGDVSAIESRMPGDRDRVRQFSVIGALDALRHRLLH